jgi:hypothetical protein
MAIVALGIAVIAGRSDSAPAAAAVTAPPTSVVPPPPQPQPKPTEWAGGPEGLPDCVDVANRSGTIVGCVLRDELFPRGDHAAPPGALEVHGPDGAVVGHFYGGHLQFVPKELEAQLDRLGPCNEQLISATEPLGPGCRELLTEQGTPRPVLDAHP